MVKTKQQIIDAEEVKQESALSVQEPQDLAKPEKDTNFAHASAKILKDIVRQNGWSRKLGGQNEHIQYEGWQTLGKYYSYTVKTFEAEPVEISGVAGFKAKAVVINEITGVECGGAEAFCFRDEKQWSGKPMFQLASMAQTRAGSKALRQILGFVVALAGYNPSPAEEMTGEEYAHNTAQQTQMPLKKERPQYSGLATEKQVKFIHDLLLQKHYNESSLLNKYEITDLGELTFEQASDAITNLTKLPVAQKKMVKPQPVKTAPEYEFDYDEIDKGIARMAN